MLSNIYFLNFFLSFHKCTPGLNPKCTNYQDSYMDEPSACIKVTIHIYFLYGGISAVF